MREVVLPAPDQVSTSNRDRPFAPRCAQSTCKADALIQLAGQLDGTTNYQCKVTVRSYAWSPPSPSQPVPAFRRLRHTKGSRMSDDTLLMREGAISHKGPAARRPGSATRPRAAVGILRWGLGHDAREQFIALFLDGWHHPIALQRARSRKPTAIGGKSIASSTLIASHPRPSPLGRES